MIIKTKQKWKVKVQLNNCVEICRNQNTIEVDDFWDVFPTKNCSFDDEKKS